MAVATTKLMPVAPSPTFAEAKPSAIRAWHAHRNKFWAIADQGLYACGNLAVIVFLARRLPPDQYGIFSLAQSLYFVLAGIQSALIIEPLLVFRQKHYSTSYGHYYSITLAMSLTLSLIFLIASLPAAFAAIELGQPNAKSILLGVNIMSPPAQILWIMRRACFAEFRPQVAATGGVLYVITTFLLILITGTHGVSLQLAFIVIATASLPSILFLTKTLGVSLPPKPAKMFSEAIAKHWSYGKWSLHTTLLRWLPFNAPQWFLATYWGPGSAANLKVLSTPVIPLIQILGSLSSLLIPTFANLDRDDLIRAQVRRRLIGGVLLALGYVALLALLHQQIINIMFGANYRAISPLLPWSGLAVISEVAVSVLVPYFIARLQPKTVFITYTASAAFTVIAGATMIFWFSTAGAVGVGVAAGFITAFTLGLFYRRAARSPLSTATL